MISCSVLERPGKWRAIGIALLEALAFVPALVLILSTRKNHLELGAAFIRALSNSARVAALAGGLSFAVGLPLGILAALYAFPLRRCLMAAIAVPLLAPSFLWATGIVLLPDIFGRAIFRGEAAAVLVFSSAILPLVFFMSFAATRMTSSSACDAARLGGGELHVLRCVAGAAWPAAALSAVLGGVMTLSDPGPDQMLGFRGVASEILASFAAQYDFALAARQCLVLAGVVLVFAVPAAIMLSAKVAAELARPTARVLARDHVVVRRLAPAALGVTAVLTTGLPLIGLLAPSMRALSFEQAWHTLARTTFDTLLYSTTSALIALVVGVTLALCAGRNARLRGLLFAITVVQVTLPPSLGALGFVQLASYAPAGLDALFRGRLAVSLNAAVRCVPVVVIFAMRAVAVSTPSWVEAAALHGVSLRRYVFRVLLPWLAPALVIAAGLSVLLSTADITSVHLLHPPGAPSFPLAIFTVMANAPEPLVATLCLLYVAGGVALVAASLAMTRLLRIV